MLSTSTASSFAYKASNFHSFSQRAAPDTKTILFILHYFIPISTLYPHRNEHRVLSFSNHQPSSFYVSPTLHFISQNLKMTVS